MAAWLAGDGDANDISGNNNNGILEGNVTFPAGEVAQAFGLDGTTADVKVPASASLNVGAANGLTIDAWINPTDVSRQQAIVEWNNSNIFGAHFYISVGPVGGDQPGTLYANLYDTGGNTHRIVSNPGLITSNTFQHVALTYDKSSGQAQLYLNGTSIASANLGTFTPQTSYDAYLGLRPGGSGTGFRFGGRLDEVEIFNRALSQTEIQSIVNAGSAGKCKPAPCPTITLSPSSLPNGTAGSPYSQTIAASGGLSPYTFTVTSGSLPPGLTLAPSSGQISGTPSATGPFNFTVTAKDANNCTGSQPYSITINCPAIAVNPSTLPAGTVGASYDQTVSERRERFLHLRIEQWFTPARVDPQLRDRTNLRHSVDGKWQPL